MHCPGQIATVRPGAALGYPNRARVGSAMQNERDLAMVKDPPTDLEEVVGGT